MRLKIFSYLLIILIFSCAQEEETELKSPKDLTTYNVISYLNAHPVIDTSMVKIPDNYLNLIMVKSLEKKLLEDWLKDHSGEKSEDSFLSIWSQFGDVLDLITLEFKITQSLGLNPRIVFFKKESFYRELGLPFLPFANESVFDVLQNQLLFAQELIENNSEKNVKKKLDAFFKRNSHFSKDQEDALRFDLMRWYILEEEGFIRHKDSNSIKNDSLSSD